MHMSLLGYFVTLPLLRYANFSCRSGAAITAHCIGGVKSCFIWTILEFLRFQDAASHPPTIVMFSVGTNGNLYKNQRGKLIQVFCFCTVHAVHG